MAGVNKITRSVAPKSIFESAQSVISSALTIAQGDLVSFDASAHLILVPTAETDGATFLGIMRDSISAGKLLRPYSTDVDGSAAISDVPGPLYGVVAKVVLKTGDSLNPGDLIYLNPRAGTRHVQAAGTKPIGILNGPAVSSAAAGTEIEVLIGSRYPLDTLKL